MPDFSTIGSIIKSYLDEWGIGELANDLNNIVVDGDSVDTAVAKIRATDTYKRRFKANEERKRNGLPVLSEAEVLANERTYRQALSNYGLPTGFYDSYEDFVNWIAHDTSPQEIQARAQDAAERYLFASQETKAMADKFAIEEYGRALTPSEYIAKILDPDKAEPLIRQKLVAAGIAAEAARSFRDQDRLSRTRAEDLASQGLTEQQARQGFGELASHEQRDQFLAGVSGENLTQKELEDEALFGRQSATRKRLIDQERSRFSGSYVGQQTGLTTAPSY